MQVPPVGPPSHTPKSPGPDPKTQAADLLNKMEQFLQKLCQVAHEPSSNPNKTAQLAQLSEAISQVSDKLSALMKDSPKGTFTSQETGLFNSMQDGIRKGFQDIAQDPAEAIAQFQQVTEQISVFIGDLNK